MNYGAELDTPERALAIAAHPDDIEFGSGATLAKWAASGCEVSLLVCTDGSKGTWNASADTDELVVTRKREQLRAAETLGATGEVIFLGWPDGELESGLRQRAEVASHIRRRRPVVVLGHDPWRRYRLHPDHRHAGLLAVEGIVAARDPHFFPELGVEHHRPETLLLFEADEVDHLEPTHGFENAKLAALECHESQFESTMFVSRGDDGSEIDKFRAKVLGEMADFGARGRGPVLAEGGFAEGFKRIDL